MAMTSWANDWGVSTTNHWPLTSSKVLTLMFIDLERDSAIRVQALMALAAYSVRKSSNKFGFSLT